MLMSFESRGELLGVFAELADDVRQLQTGGRESQYRCYRGNRGFLSTVHSVACIAYTAHRTCTYIP